MSLPRALLDTDTLSAVMRGLPPVRSKAREYLAEHRVFSFSIITRHEIRTRLSDFRDEIRRHLEGGTIRLSEGNPAGGRDAPGHLGGRPRHLHEAHPENPESSPRAFRQDRATPRHAR